MDSFLSAHPERPLSFDELSNAFEGDHHVHGSLPRQSIISLRAELSSLPARDAERRSSSFLRLGDALLRRFSQWAQKDDLEEAIWFYEEALSLIPNSHYHYLEALLGLCSSLLQRYYLLGHADDLHNLLLHLDLQCDLLNRHCSLLASIKVELCRPSPVLDLSSISQSSTFPFAPGSHNSVLYPDLGQASLPCAYPVPSLCLLPRFALPDPGFLMDLRLKPYRFGPQSGGMSAFSPSFADSATHSLFNSSPLDWIHRCKQIFSSASDGTNRDDAQQYPTLIPQEDTIIKMQ